MTAIREGIKDPSLGQAIYGVRDYPAIKEQELWNEVALLNAKFRKPRVAEVVLKWRFVDHKTLQECAEHLGCSRERIRQIEGRCLRFLRHPGRRKRYEVGEGG